MEKEITGMFAQSFPKLKVIRHKCATLENQTLISYKKIYTWKQPDVVLIDTHGLLNHHTLSVPNYATYQHSRRGQLHAGVGIALRKDLEYMVTVSFQYM